MSKCIWTRLPDSEHPFELHKYVYEVGCNGNLARGAQPIYPDHCPSCGLPVQIGGAPGGAEP